MKVFIALFFLFLGAAMISAGYPERPELVVVGIIDLLVVVATFWWEHYLAHLFVTEGFDEPEPDGFIGAPEDGGVS